MGYVLGDGVEKVKDVSIFVSGIPDSSQNITSQAVVIQGQVQLFNLHSQELKQDQELGRVALLIPVPKGGKLLASDFPCHQVLEACSACFPGTKKKVFQDPTDEDEDDEDASAAEAAAPAAAKPVLVAAASLFTLSISVVESADEIKKLVGPLIPQTVGTAMEKKYADSHYILLLWKYKSSDPHPHTTDLNLPFSFAYTCPVPYSRCVSVQPCAFSPNQYETQKKIPAAKQPRRRISINNTAGHDDDDGEHKSDSFFPEDDEMATAFYEHKIYSFDSRREDGAKNSKETLDSMRHRFASGSMVDIVYPTNHYCNVAKLMASLGVPLGGHAGAAAAQESDDGHFRLRRIVGLHPFGEFRFFLAL